MDFYNNNNNFINDNNNYEFYDMGSYFNPLTEQSNIQLLNFFNYNMDLETIISEYGGFNITVDCIFNKKIMDTMKNVLLKEVRYLNSIKLKEYYLNNIDHALIYFLNILNSNPKVSDKSIIHSIKIAIKIEKPNSIIDLVLLVQKYSISSMSYYFGEYYLYYLLLLDDIDMIKTNIKFTKCPELILVYSIFKVSKDYLNIYLDLIKNSDYLTNEINFTNIEFESSLNEKDISLLNLNHIVNNIKDGIKSWLLIFRIFIRYRSSEFLKYFLESLYVARTNYIFLIKNYFFDMIIYHIDLNNPNDQNKINILFDYLEMDEIEKSTFRLSIYNSISGIGENNKINSLEEVINYLLCLSSYKKLPSFINDIIIYVVNNLQFLELPKLLSVYRNIDKKLYNTIFNKKNNNPFFQFKSNLLLIPLLNSIKSMNKQAVVDILNTVFNNYPFDIVNNNQYNEINNNFSNQNNFFNFDDPNFMGDQKLIENNFNQINVIIPETVNDSISLIRHLLFNGFLIEFDLNQFFAEIFSNNRFNKMEIILILVCDEFKESNYKNQFNFKVLNNSFLNSQELLFLHTNLDQLQKDQLFSNKTNYLNEYDFYDENEEEMQDEINDVYYQDNEEDYDNVDYQENEENSDNEEEYHDIQEFQNEKDMESEPETPYYEENSDGEKGNELYKQYMTDIEKEFMDTESLFKESKENNDTILITLSSSEEEGKESSDSESSGNSISDFICL